MSPSTSHNRLELAAGSTDRENPLVARVTVNRWWAEFFGRGIVGTLEDFGVKGDPPTHPNFSTGWRWSSWTAAGA
jgi:hypothetical protein